MKPVNLVAVAAREAIAIHKATENFLFLPPPYDPVKGLWRYMYSELRAALRQEPEYAAKRYIYAHLLKELIK